MQTPERIALIGGGILLSSTLIFTLKSQASQILPKVTHPVQSIYDKAGDAQNDTSFQAGLRSAQKEGLRTGTWGTAKWYIDRQQVVHIGAGQLQSELASTVGYDEAPNLKGLVFEQHVQAPQDSSRLFANLSSITNMRGMDKIDTSSATNMFSMFSNDYQLNDLDLSSWQMSQVMNMNAMFSATSHLNRLNLQGWHTQSATDMGWLFYGSAMNRLDLSDWDTSQVTSTSQMFANNPYLSDVNIAHWNTTNLKDASSMFAQDTSLPNIDFSGWRTNQANDLSYMFSEDTNLQGLDLHDLDTTNANTSGLFIYTSGKLSDLNLGSNTYLKDHINMSDGIWHNGDQSLNSQQILDGNAHPGRWIKR